jgi:hypothetical protein
MARPPKGASGFVVRDVLSEIQRMEDTLHIVTKDETPCFTMDDMDDAQRLVGMAIQLRSQLRAGRDRLPLPAPERESAILALSNLIEASEVT